jgi:squalene-hopene/tetraprenyl-beta-curcumene cyclase
MKFWQTMLGLPLIAVGMCPAIAAASDLGLAQVSNVPNKRIAWDKLNAAKYLDDRMDLWFVKAKKLRTGQKTTSCVSCHTVVPYAMARPLLRKAAGMSKPTPQEAKLLEETLHRVDTYGSHEPFYKGKEEQSRGTEAVLNLLILACEDFGQNGQALSGPTHKALEELWKEQRADGAWDWLDFGLEPYESTDSIYYGAALAAIAVGTATGYKGENASMGVNKLRTYLKANYADQNLYSRAWMLLASTHLAGLLNRDQTDALTTDLQRRQNADGGWALYKLGPWTWSKAIPPYGPEGKPDVELVSKSDGYATGLIAFVLRQAGLPPSHPTVKKATDWLEANQNGVQIDQSRWKCWRTYSLNYDHEHGGDDGEPWRRMFMSDAATAFAALALLPSD